MRIVVLHAPFDRRALLRNGVSASAKVLEIGASYNPLFPKREGWRVVVADHDDRAGLVKKYANSREVNVDLIEEVDFIWGDATPSEYQNAFDYVVASHVIEHAPDLIGFFRLIDQFLAPHGAIILAVPDKRMCFDFYRPCSTTGDVIEAHRTGSERHPFRTLFDYRAYNSSGGKHQAGVWHLWESARPTLNFEVEDSLRFAENSVGQKDYIDAHRWVFTPTSFELILFDCGTLSMLDLAVERVEPTDAVEFFAWLRKGFRRSSGLGVAEVRRHLLRRVLLEIAEQAKQL